jgi:hypothetical protein
MEKITLEQILRKYPKIFEPYKGNPGGINWTGVPEGWLPIIDKLCDAIQSYVDNISTSVANPSYIEGKQWDRNDVTTHKYILQYSPQVKCTQMKEKFGGLRFYTTGTDDNIDGMIHMAERMCINTCDRCSSEHELGVTKGWISICCRSCAQKEGILNKWQTKEEFKNERSISIKQSGV